MDRDGPPVVLVQGQRVGDAAADGDLVGVLGQRGGQAIGFHEADRGDAAPPCRFLSFPCCRHHRLPRRSRREGGVKRLPSGKGVIIRRSDCMVQGPFVQPHCNTPPPGRQAARHTGTDEIQEDFLNG